MKIPEHPGGVAFPPTPETKESFANVKLCMHACIHQRPHTHIQAHKNGYTDSSVTSVNYCHLYVYMGEMVTGDMTPCTRRSKDSLMESVLSFHLCVDSLDQTQAVRLAWQALYLPRHLTGPVQRLLGIYQGVPSPHLVSETTSPTKIPMFS